MKIFIKTKPNSKHESVKKEDDIHFSVAIHEAPVDGKANKSLVKILAEYFKVPKSQIHIVSGHAGRSKVVEIPGKI